MSRVRAAVVIVGEFIASQRGLGYLILFASSRQQTDLSLACIVVLCAVGLALYGCVVVVEAIVQKWLGVAITTGEF